MMETKEVTNTQPVMAGETMNGVVTWFSNAKGFGFVKPHDGSEDVFVHISVVQTAGLQSLRDGATLSCIVGPGKKGRQVVQITQVDNSTATGPAITPRLHTRDNEYYPPIPEGEEGDPGSGVVKWFNITKGFGFIAPDNGGKDVFLHASVVRRAGYVDVQAGQRVNYTAIDREKGPEARTVSMV